MQGDNAMITFTETMIKISEIQENYSGGQIILNAAIDCCLIHFIVNLCI